MDLGGRNESEPLHLRGRRRRSGWLRGGLRRGLGDRSGGAELADMDEGVDAALVQWDAWVVAGIATDGILVGHGDTETGDVLGPHHGRWSNVTHGGVRLVPVGRTRSEVGGPKQGRS
jgi:hypothetical protein